MSTTLPKFSKINPEAIVADLEKILAHNREAIPRLLTGIIPLDWSLLDHLDTLDDALQHFWSPINHLYSVQQTPELRAVYDQCILLLSAYNTEFGQNNSIYQAIKDIANSNHDFDYAQEKCLHNTLRDFHLGGVDLPQQKQERYRDIQLKLAELSNKFEKNLLDSTANWSKLVQKKTELSGLSDYIITGLEQAARDKNLSGYLLTLDYSLYLPILRYADDRSLRKAIYKAQLTRASDLGDAAFDNSPILLEILNLRYELSQLLGFSNYAQTSLASNKMVKHTDEVIRFLENLLPTVREKATEEWQTLSEFARTRDQLDDLQHWDVLYYQEKLKEKTFGIHEDILRCYFPVEKVLSGLFCLLHRLFGIHIQEMRDVDVWDSSVQFFSILDSEQQLRGQFYLDLYARPTKREGAWMDEYQSRRRLSDGSIQVPIAFLTCNFSHPSDPTQATLLTHEEVLTLFHEFGHGLQHMLTLINYSGVSGINGVAWDVVELPSQFLEYFAWETPVLKLISSHHQTGQSLSSALITNIRAAKNFHAGLGLLKQIELSLFDFLLHIEFDPSEGYGQIQQLLDQIRTRTSIIPSAVFDRFQHGFLHIFSGAYAAGYYSYLWAEVLACDAFYKFLEQGIFDPATGQAFLHTFLEQGGAIDAVDLFQKFRGRVPKIQAFLQNLDICPTAGSA